MKFISLPDALSAMEQAVSGIIAIAGRKPGDIRAIPDSITGTASVTHYTGMDGSLSCEVHFPIATHDARLSSQEVDRWTGYFLHEVCHVLYTDDSAWKAAVNEGLHKIVNGLEDVRIERKLINAGISDNARDVLTGLMMWAESKVTPDYDPNDWRQVPWTLAYLGRWKVNQYPLAKAAGYYARLADPAIIAAIDEVARAKSTGDCLEIARRLQKALAKRPGEGKGKPGDNGKKGDKPGQAGQDGKPQDDAGQGQDGVQGDKQAPEDRAEGDAGNGSGGNGGGLSEGDMVDSEDLLDPRSEQTKQQAERDIKSNPYYARANAAIIEIIRDLQKAPRRTHVPNESTNARVKDMRETLTKKALKCGRMKQQAVRVLRAPDSVTWSRNQPKGRLDRFAMARIGMGATESVYGRRDYSEGFETEITLLIDGSGSMQGSGAEAASVFALALAQAADQVAVSCEVRVFKDGADIILKKRNERSSNKTIQSRLALAALSASGGTPLSKALVDNANILAKNAPNKRKILFALTDGGCGYGSAVLAGAAKYAARLGVEVVGLSIDAPVHGCFQYEVQISSRGNVAEAGLGALVHVLEQKVGA